MYIIGGVTCCVVSTILLTLIKISGGGIQKYLL